MLHRRLFRLVVGGLLVAVALFFFTGKQAFAQITLAVTQCNDAGLRAAINTLQADVVGGTLTFNCPVEPATIALTDGNAPDGVLPTITKLVIIDGGGTITLSGANASRIFFVGPTGQLTVQNLHLTHGLATGDGGAIFNQGRLGVENSRFTENRSSIGGGGAITTYGPTTIIQSEFAFNQARNGGALQPVGGAVVTINQGNFHDNTAPDPLGGMGGAMLLWDGPQVTIFDTEVYSNSSEFKGGGIYVTANSALTVTSSTIENNTADKGGSGVYNGGVTLIQRSLLRGNASGDQGDSGTLLNHGDLTVRSSTIAESRGPAFVSVSGTTRLLYATVTHSTGFGFQAGYAILAGSGTVEIRNSILAGNQASNCQIFSQGVLTSQGFNISDDSSCNLSATGDRPQNTNPQIGPLADNGGPSLTHMLLPGSPAIDNGQCTTGATTDQRSLTRPQGVACDIGAVEVGQYSLTVAKTGQGTVAGGPITCGSTCTAVNIRENTQITLTATPATGFTFVGWGGGCSGKTPCTFTMFGNRNVTATFQAGVAPMTPRGFLPTIRK